MNWMSYYSEFWSTRMDALEKHISDEQKRATK
jgi:hypothetical protein